MFISRPDAHLFSLAFGAKTAPTLLALSGWIGSWEDWADTFSVMSEDWRVVSYDHRGTGSSQAPVASISFDNLVADVFAVMDAHGLQRCVLGAMSSGAAVAVAAILQRPERFSGLVLVNGVVHRDKPTEADPFLQLLRHNHAQALARFIGACVPEPDCEPIKHWGRQILERASPEAAQALYQTVSSVDLRPLLGQLTLPTLVLHGDADPLVSVQSARELSEAMPNAKLVLMPGAGHVPIMTRPHDVAREIMTHFAA